MKNLFFAAAMFLALALSFQSAYAQSDDGIDFTNIMQYNLPDEIGGLIGNARVNIYDFDSHELGSILVVNGIVVNGSSKVLEEATHTIFVKDKGVIQDIFNADSFTKEFNRQRSVHNIRVEAFDFVEKIKLAIGTIVISLISVFIVG